MEIIWTVNDMSITDLDVNCMAGILSYVDDKTLRNFMQASYWCRNVAQNNLTWYTRILLRLPGLHIPFEYRDKYREYYLRIRSIESTSAGLRLSIVRQYSEVIDCILANNIVPTVQDTNLAMKYGSIAVLESGKNYNIQPTREGLELAAHNNEVASLQWIKDTYGITCMDALLHKALYGDSIDVLIWLEKYDIVPDENDAFLAVTLYHIRTLDWLEKRNIYPNVNNGIIANSICRLLCLFHLPTLMWLESRNLISVQGLLLLGYNFSRTDVVSWLRTRPWKSTNEAVGHILQEIMIGSMKCVGYMWMATKYIYRGLRYIIG